MTDARTFLSPGDVFDALTEDECRVLLAGRTFGRVGVTSGGLPVILPVRYLYADGEIRFRTGGGTKLRAAESGDVVAFEVDSYDGETGAGWSVLVLGRATVVTATADHDGLPMFDPKDAGGRRDHDIHLHCELITGRRLVTARSGASASTPSAE